MKFILLQDRETKEPLLLAVDKIISFFQEEGYTTVTTQDNTYEVKEPVMIINQRLQKEGKK